MNTLCHMGKTLQKHQSICHYEQLLHVAVDIHRSCTINVKHL